LTESRVLVTGGCGFIGGHLCHALVSGGERVTVLDNLSTGRRSAIPEAARVIEGDITDREALATALDGVTDVVHLAAISSVEQCTRHRLETQRTNLGGTEALLAASGVRPIVYASSAAVYGDQVEQPVREDAALAPLSPYAEDKAASEALLRNACASGTLRAVALRPFNVYGAGQRRDSPYSGVITLFAERARSGQALRINGDGGQTRDFIHVRDVVRALRASLALVRRAPPGRFEAINACTGSAIPVRHLAALIDRLAGNTVRPIMAPARTGDIRHSCGDPSKAEHLLGVTAQRDMEADLMRLLGDMAAAPAT